MPAFLRIIATTAVFCLLACAAGGDEETLELQGLPDTLAVGGVTPDLVVTKKVRNAQGRMQTIPDYTDFTLVSDSPNVADTSLSPRRIRGISAGATSITARDIYSYITSGKYPLTVVP